jgi:putative MFS transporter
MNMPKLPTASSATALLDATPLDAKFWGCFTLIAIAGLIDFFDLFVIGFIIAVVGPAWHLTFGQVVTVLLAAGVGAIIGSLVGGALSDRFGRKPIFVTGGMVCALSSGAIALIPEGAWLLLAALRFLVGMSLTFVLSSSMALIVERTPTRVRAIVPALTSVGPALGVFLAALCSATLLPIIGWRGLAALGFSAAIPAILALLFIGESIPWLIASGQRARALEAASKRLQVPAEDLILEIPEASPSQSIGGWREILGSHGRGWLIVITWLGIATAINGLYLWGPTILALTHRLTVPAAAALFMYVSIASLLGKIVFSVVPQWTGRRPAALFASAFGTASILAAAFALEGDFYGLPWRLLAFMAGAFFLDGATANMAPFSAEMFPVRLAARAVGLAQAANGVGKILGPLSLAVIAGTGNVVAPAATTAAIFPGFTFLAFCVGAAFLAFLFIPVETQGRQLQLTKDW